MNITQLKNKKVGIISLGCDKNRVDTEHILGLLKQYGFSITNQIDQANIIIINTCSFIHDAREESIQAILESVGYKKQVCEKVFVVGCLSSRPAINVQKKLPQVDAFVALKDNKNIIKIIENLYELDSNFKPANLPPNRVVSTPPHYAYLKIADGCNNACSYCTIPAIKGKFKSEPIEALVEEATALVKNGVKELVLVAQDVTRYGIDLYKEPKLIQLIEELSKIKNLKWIRLHYCYPEMVSDELIKQIATNEKVCKYIDIPFQHINDKVLSNMNRISTNNQITNLVKKIRSHSNDIAIRSTFIVGFPGETHKQFKELYKFLKEYKLNYVGFFTYSKEPNTVAYNMKKQVPEKVKNKRLKRLQKLQAKVLQRSNINQVGNTCIVLCDGVIKPSEYYVARTQQNSPEVDTVVTIKTNKPLNVGEFYKIKITKALGIDLEGEVL
jgi:ribosomal protein S12 methylthiotransferase